MNVLVTGAGGFIGGHLVGDLLKDGHHVRAADIKPTVEWYQLHDKADNWDYADLKEADECRMVTAGMDQVYNLAADMGGMGFIETHKAECMLSVLISTNMLVAALNNGVRRLFYSSSACVYNATKQTDPQVTALREEDAYPAMPEDGYGWEKLFSERMCRHFMEDYGLETRVARYHNVYGPHGTYQGGREKAPAAICRKMIEAKLTGKHVIDVWGDGQQTRSFMFIDDCIRGTRRIMDSDICYPLNLGSSELVTINHLIAQAAEFADITDLEYRYDVTAPQGVRGRNSDNSMIQEELGWAPNTSLRLGLSKTYQWIYDQMIHDQWSNRTTS